MGAMGNFCGFLWSGHLTTGFEQARYLLHEKPRVAASKSHIVTNDKLLEYRESGVTAMPERRTLTGSVRRIPQWAEATLAEVGCVRDARAAPSQS